MSFQVVFAWHQKNCEEEHEQVLPTLRLQSDLLWCAVWQAVQTRPSFVDRKSPGRIRLQLVGTCCDCLKPTAAVNDDECLQDSAASSRLVVRVSREYFQRIPHSAVFLDGYQRLSQPNDKTGDQLILLQAQSTNWEIDGLRQQGRRLRSSQLRRR